MRVFARFDSDGICRGHIVSHDPSFTPSAGYEEMYTQQDQQMVLSGRCKKIGGTNQNDRIIVLY